MRFEHSVVIAATPDEVWQVYSDVERWPEWTASVSRVERLDDGPLKVGARTRVIQPKLPKAVWKVTELVPGSHFVWVATGPGLTTIGSHHVTSGDRGEDTIATATLDQTGPLGWIVGRVTAKLTREYLQLEAEGLRARCER